MATFLDSLMGGMKFGQQVRGLQDQGNINRLAGQAANSSGQERTSALNQMWGVNPEMAAKQETALGTSEDRRNKGMVNAARLITNAPESMRPALYQQMKPTLAQYGLQLPEHYDQTVSEAASALVRAYGGASDSTPSGLRQFQGIAEAAGLKPGSDEYQRAARVSLGLDGRASGAGYRLVKFTGPDGRDRIGTMSGATGVISLPDGTTFDPRATGVQFTAIEESVAPQGGGQLDFVSDFQQFQQAGIPISSTVRTDQRNREVGGTANSYHLTGEALDIAPRNAQEKAAAQQYWQSRGYQVIDEGDHLHVEPPSRGMTASRLGGQQQSPQRSAGMFVGPTKAEEAADVEQAKLGVELGGITARGALETDVESSRVDRLEREKSSREREQKAVERAVNAADTLNLLQNAERLLGDATGSGVGAIYDSANAFFGRSTEGRQANASLKTLSGQLTSKMPRMEGPQSDRDVQMYKEMAGDLGNEEIPVQTRLAALAEIRRLNQKYAHLQGQGAPSAQSPQPRQQGAVQIQNAADYNRLPSGALYITPTGETRRKR